ncbi:unnamed protein product, partial [Rotaria socialis]
MWFKGISDINEIHPSSATGTSEKTHQYSDETSKKPKEHNSGQTQTGSNYNVVADTDVYLRRLEIILKRIHTTFYMAYDQWIDGKHGTMPDLKQIIPDIRRQILSSVSLCFSHIIQQNHPMEKHNATIMAQAMGANVTQDLQFDHDGIIETTHVIAGKITLKVYQAQQNNIKVVTPEWLSDCYEQWEKQPEDNYILTRNYKVRKWRFFTEDTPRVSKRRHCDIQQPVSVSGHYGSIILEYEECRHAITFKNLCGDCGIDLSQFKNALSVSTAVKTLISIEPSFPDANLLCKRQLHLLINLDQTLIDTTNSRNYYPSSSDIVAYQPTPISKIFYTKLRPGIKEFLTNLRPFYQFHIITFGDQAYAHNIAKLIDPNRRFFSDRIISRDECLKLTDETINLNNLFPFDDSLVCIIDGREDIWKSTRNLVYVKPYMWFKGISDINEIHPSSATGTSEKTHQYSDETSKKPKEHNSGQTQTGSNYNVVADTDVYLRRLEIILKRIHTTFYMAYDQWIDGKHGTMPDLKQIIPDIRR